MIKKSTLRDDPSPEKRALYNKYYPLIEATLTFCPDDFKLENLSSLKAFEPKGAFESFIRDATRDEIKTAFDKIMADVETLADSYFATNVRKCREEATATTIGVQWMGRVQKKKDTWFKILMTVLCILSIGVVVFSILEARHVIESEGVISACIGALDLAIGIGFFIYERHDDNKKKHIQDFVGKVAPTFQVEIGKMDKVGDNNQIGIFTKISKSSDLSRETEERTKHFRELVLESSQSVKIKSVRKFGNDNKIGITHEL